MCQQIIAFVNLLLRFLDATFPDELLSQQSYLFVNFIHLCTLTPMTPTCKPLGLTGTSRNQSSLTWRVWAVFQSLGGLLGCRHLPGEVTAPLSGFQSQTSRLGRWTPFLLQQKALPLFSAVVLFHQPGQRPLGDHRAASLRPVGELGFGNPSADPTIPFLADPAMICSYASS